MAAFLTQTFDLAGGELPAAPPDAFPDDQGGTFERQTNQLAALGITTGSGDRRYAPTEVVSRGQMTTFLVRTANLLLDEPLPTGEDAFGDEDGSVHETRIDQASAAGIAAGFSATRFGPLEPVNRQQMSAFITRKLDVVVAGRECLVSGDPFYDQYCDVDGIPLVADAVVDPQALRVAAGYAPAARPAHR